jgi:hypothetical protein
MHFPLLAKGLIISFSSFQIDRWIKEKSLGATCSIMSANEGLGRHFRLRHSLLSCGPARPKRLLVN